MDPSKSYINEEYHSISKQQKTSLWNEIQKYQKGTNYRIAVSELLTRSTKATVTEIHTIKTEPNYSWKD